MKDRGARRSRLVALLAGGALACAIGGAPPARAQGRSPAPARDPAAAEALFNSARELLRQGDWDAACAKLQASMDLDPAVSTLLKLAKCREHEGKLALAWYDYQRALKLNVELAGTTEERRRELEDFARSALAALEPAVPRLRIVVRQPPAGLRLTRDGRDLPVGSLGEPLPVDPGEHVVRAEAPGHRAAGESVVLERGERKDVVLELAPEGDATAPPAPGDAAARGAPPAREPRRARTPPPPPPPPPYREIAGAVLGATGLVALGAAGVYGLSALSSVDAASEHCDASWVCEDQEGLDLLDRAGRAQTTGLVLLGVGAAATIGGVVLFATAAGPEVHGSARPRVSVAAAPTGVSGRVAW